MAVAIATPNFITSSCSQGVFMDREQKKKSAEELHEELMKARGIILSGFQGITVAQDFRAAPEGRRDGCALQGGEEQPD